MVASAPGARHIVTENGRVLEAVGASNSGDFEAFCGLIYASHNSMLGDYEISAPSHDGFVRLARDATGAVGARLTGGGFGGCAIALVPKNRRESLTEATLFRFRELSFPAPTFHEFIPAHGASVSPQNPLDL